MNFRINISLRIFLMSAGMALSAMSNAQIASGDSLSLDDIINQVVQNHPMVTKTTEELNVADAKIASAKTGYLPTVDFTSSVTLLGPISRISIPDMGSLSFMPRSNYSATINASQILSDFGKTEANVLLEEQSKELTKQTIEQIKQKLSQNVISSYYSLLYLQEAIKIKDEQIQTLNEHLQYVKKKQETGSATPYEILTTEVRISNAETQRTDLETGRLALVHLLNSLLGYTESTNIQVKHELKIPLTNLQRDNLIASALQNRDEMKLAEEKVKLLELRQTLAGSQNKPVLSAFANGGMKNGYMPSLYIPKANFVAGIGLKIPIYDGKRSKYSLDQATSAIRENNQETEMTRRTIINEVSDSEASANASMKKVEQGELMLKQATQAYELAKVRFDSGVITNVELLDGSTALSDCRLQFLKARIEYTVNLYKLKSAIGERLY